MSNRRPDPDESREFAGERGRWASRLVWVAAAVAGLLLAAPSSGQSPEADVPTGPIAAQTEKEPWVIPEVPDRWLDALNIHTPYFTLHWGLGVIGDYTLFEQNASSIAQVGEQRSGPHLRTFRILNRGTFQLLVKWDYLFDVEYNGFDRQPGDPLWNVLDLWFSTRLGSIATLRFGKQKESFVYEIVCDGANLPQTERYLSPFFTSRSVGVSLMNTYLNEHATWTVGWFNKWWTEGEPFSVSGNDYAARFTFLPVYGDEGKQYLHLAVASRYHERDHEVLRFRGSPQSDQTSSYVDTGTFRASHAWNLGFEALWANGPFSVLGEYVKAWVPSERLGNPSFYGWYVTASWVFTGVPRPYDRHVGYARRVPVEGDPLGALELFVRYGRVDLNGGTITGGAMDEWYGGLSWFATRRWKVAFGYGNVDLDRFGVHGRTNIFLWRLQWIR